MKLGLSPYSVKVVPYDPEWPKEFALEKARLLQKFGNELKIEHVGSTAVPGLPAKPIIDMLMAVESFEKLEYYATTLQDMGYEYKSRNMFKGRKFFPKNQAGKHTHHISLVIQNDPRNWDEKLSFRDALRKDNTMRDKYASLKQELARKYVNDRDSYTLAKDDFINKALHQN